MFLTDRVNHIGQLVFNYDINTERMWFYISYIMPIIWMKIYKSFEIKIILQLTLVCI